jgi:dTDP-4-amino-4,6-dideoxy-D-glucose acyltransferase
MAFLPEHKLASLGLLRYGKNVLISDKACLYNPGNISIGDNVRIDDFCILSAGEGGIEIGSFVHIACYSSLIGKAKIRVEDFSGISARCSIFSSSDDFSGNFLTGPTIDSAFINPIHKEIHLKKHVVVGAGSVILPGVEIGTGAAIGALSVVKNNVEDFTIVGGNPAVYLKDRSGKLLQLEEEFLLSIGKNKSSS